MDRTRRIAWAVTLASAAAFGASLQPLTQRIRDFNESAGFLRLHAELLGLRKTKVGIYPELSLTDAPLGEGGDPGPGRIFLKLEYGGKVQYIPVKKPPAPDMPTLGIYDEWIKVLAINQVELKDGESVPKPESERLLIVNRRTPEGFDPETWGSVFRDEWVFDFYDLKPDGSIQKQTRRWPRPVESERRLQTQVQDMSAGKAGADQRIIEFAAIKPLDERSVEYFAAMHVIPKLNVPKYKFTDTAFSPHVLGWTLPVSMLSALGLTGGLIFAFAPRRSVEAAKA